MRKSILYISPFFPPYDVGGMELSLKLLAETMAKKGWQVELATPGYGERTVRFEGTNPRVIYIPWADNRKPSSLFHHLAAARFSKLVQRHAKKPDLIDAYAWPQPAISLKQAWKIPVVASIRDASFISDLRSNEIPKRLHLGKYLQERFSTYKASPVQLIYGLYGYWRTNYTWKNLEKADFITYASEALHDLFHQLRVPGKAVYSVANPDHFVPPDFAIPYRNNKLPLFVYAGRLNKGKGALLAHTVALNLINKGFPFQLAFIGKGDLDSTLAQGDHADILLPLGRLTREETQSVMHQATATLVPSVVFEGFPRAAIESIALGTPVIGSNVGGIPEAVGKSGIIVPGNDIHALEEAMQTIVQDSGLSKKLKAAVKREEDRFTPEKMCERVKEIYLNLIDKVEV